MPEDGVKEGPGVMGLTVMPSCQVHYPISRNGFSQLFIYCLQHMLGHFFCSCLYMQTVYKNGKDLFSPSFQGTVQIVLIDNF